MSVDWSETATSQLIAIKDAIGRGSPAYAQALAAKIVGRVQMLHSQPYLGAVVEEYVDPLIRELIVYPYRIIYKTDGNDVEVLAILHGAMRLPRTPPT